MGDYLMSKIFVISDTHFCHEKIIDYASRPFSSCAEMDSAIVKNWNSVVKDNDIVFHLGDIGFSRRSQLIEILKNLKGRKKLVKGNHDIFPDSFYLDNGFEWVSKYPIIVNDFYILSHAPVWLSPVMPYVNIHGHIHQNKLEYDGYVNVSVEHINYTPILLDKIRSLTDAKISNNS